MTTPAECFGWFSFDSEMIMACTHYIWFGDSDANEYMKSSFDPKVDCAHDDILK